MKDLINFSLMSDYQKGSLILIMNVLTGFELPSGSHDNFISEDFTLSRNSSVSFTFISKLISMPACIKGIDGELKKKIIGVNE